MPERIDVPPLLAKEAGHSSLSPDAVHAVQNHRGGLLTFRSSTEEVCDARLDRK